MLSGASSTSEASGAAARTEILAPMRLTAWESRSRSSAPSRGRHAVPSGLPWTLMPPAMRPRIISG